MLAVLKSGGACVPLDPNNPTSRLHTIVQSLGNKSANLILTSATHADRLTAIGFRVLAVEPSQFSSLFTATSLRPCSATPANSAMVVFTSGKLIISSFYDSTCPLLFCELARACEAI